MQAKKLKGAVVGYGFISSKGHIPAYLERQKKQGDVSIEAIADICPARLEIAKKAIPGVRVYPDYQSLLASEKGKLDFIDIATPPCNHAEIAIAALNEGMHVLCEKPLATSLDQARAMLETAQKARRVLFPCHNYKHAPVSKRVKELIASGKIGTVHTLTLSTFRNTHAKGVTEWKTHWRREHKYSGGGIAMDHGSHSFYLTFDWLGSYPTSVTSKMSTMGPYDTEDSFAATLTFPTGVANAYLTWNAGVRKVIYTIQGTMGAIMVHDDDLELALMRKTSGPDVAQGAVEWVTEKESIASHWMDASHVSWFNSLFDQFAGAIHSSDYVGKEAKEAYRCIELITKAYESSSLGSKELRLEGL